jgi:hypothetical protein
MVSIVTILSLCKKEHHKNSCECKKCVLKALCVQQKQIKRLNERVSALEQVIRISNSVYITIGTEANPVDEIYVDTIGTCVQWPYRNLVLQ